MNAASLEQLPRARPEAGAEIRSFAPLFPELARIQPSDIADTCKYAVKYALKDTALKDICRTAGKRVRRPLRLVSGGSDIGATCLGFRQRVRWFVLVVRSKVSFDIIDQVHTGSSVR